MRVALVTEELARGSGSGGIGGAFHELALLLARSGHAVDLVFVPMTPRGDLAELKLFYRAHGVILAVPDIGAEVWDTSSGAARSYVVFRHLQAQVEPYDMVHFHDYKGLGHFSAAAKRQGLAFPSTRLVVQVHGPTRWTIEANDFPFTHEDQLRTDKMERDSIEAADVVVSPSRYMLDWLQKEGWKTQGETRVIQNPVGALIGQRGSRLAPVPLARRAEEIVLFARHEVRKGIVEFCDALDILAPELLDTGTRVTFLGPLGEINGQHSLVYLAERGKAWHFPVAIMPDCDRDAAAEYLAERTRALVVIPSPIENSPYTVLEAIALGKPLLTSCQGGAPELLDPVCAKAMTCSITGPGLAAAMRRILAKGLRVPKAAVSPEDTDAQWLALHEHDAQALATEQDLPMRNFEAPRSEPRVTLAITHHERPQKLLDALMSAARQIYRNLEIVVVDDGSSRPETLQALEKMQPLFDRLGVRFIVQENKYLGAARNAAIYATKGDYIIFLDDDDVAFPTMVSTLVRAAEATGADVMGCFNLFMESGRRLEAHPFPDNFKQKVSYLPLGGPLSLAPLDNVFSSATALIRRSALERVGGYTELRGVGHEDYELYVRLLQAGSVVKVCPMPLYLYEVGRPSMVSRTSQLRNFRRVADAIDVFAKGESWSDLISLVAGKRAQEHTDNIRCHHRKISPHASDLERLEHLPRNSAEYARVLADLATAMDARSVATALMLLHARRQRDHLISSDTVEQPLFEPNSPPKSPISAKAAEPDRHMLAAMVDLELGRIGEAVQLFCLSVERSRLLTEDKRRFLLALATTPSVAPSEFSPVVDALRRVTGCKWTDPLMGPVLFRIALRAGASSMALLGVEAVLREDVVFYQAAYADVQRADPSEQFAIMHFQQYGELEQRTGFALSLSFVRIIEQELREEVSLSEMRDVVTALDGVSLTVLMNEADFGDQAGHHAVVRHVASADDSSQAELAGAQQDSRYIDAIPGHRRPLQARVGM